MDTRNRARCMDATVIIADRVTRAIVATVIQEIRASRVTLVPRVNRASREAIVTVNRGYGPRRSNSQGNFSRRDSNENEGGLPRPIERPMGGPSSTMRPAQSSAQEAAPVQVARPEQQGPEKIGVVTQYLDDARIATIKIEKGNIRSGDWIEIQGNISSLRQKVDSIQLDNQPIQEAHEGQDVGIRVIRPVKVGDAIVRLRG